jgi:hypothetical protein
MPEGLLQQFSGREDSDRAGLRNSKPNPGDTRSTPTADDSPSAQPKQPTAPPELAPPKLVLTNPLENAGPIHYLLDDRVCTLEAGESQVLRAGRPRRVRFDRGDGLQAASRTLTEGQFQFIVTSGQGWQLVPASTETD